MSLDVTGKMTIDEQGNIVEYTIDQPEKVPTMILDMTKKRISEWKLELNPLQKKQGQFEASIQMLFLANVIDKDHMSIRLADESIIENDSKKQPEEDLRSNKLPPPRYPESLLTQNVTADVFVDLKIGKDGKVIDAIASRTNLRTLGDEEQRQKWSKEFERSALQQAKRWTFIPPTIGEMAKDAYWKARVPVSYVINHSGKPAYGKWDVYIPGELKTASWLSEDSILVDKQALPSGGIYTEYSCVKLKDKK